MKKHDFDEEPLPPCFWALKRFWVNFINVLLAAFAQKGLHQTCWCIAQGVQCRKFSLFLVVCIGRVGRNFIGETQRHRRMTAGAKN